jgi:hypothetical protein
MLRRSFLKGLLAVAAGVGATAQTTLAAPALLPLPDPVPIKDWPNSQSKARAAVFTNPRLRQMIFKYCKEREFSPEKYWGELVWVYKRNAAEIDFRRRYYGQDASRGWLQRAYNADLRWLAGTLTKEEFAEHYLHDPRRKCRSERDRARDPNRKAPFGEIV